MRDKNFFESFVETKGSEVDKKKILIIVGASLLALLVVFTSVNMIRIRVLNSQISRDSKELQRDDLNKKKISAEEKKELLAELDKIESELEIVTVEIDKKDMLGSYLLETITDAMPNEVFLKSVDVTEEFIALEGISRTKEDIARLEGNFRRVSYFKNVFIPEIKAEEGFFNFRVDLSLSPEGIAKRDKSQEKIKAIEPTEDVEQIMEELTQDEGNVDANET